MFKILQPALLQTIGFILFHSNSCNNPQILNFWHNQTEPVMVLSDDGSILFQSKAFEQTLEPYKKTFLSSAMPLIKTIQQQKKIVHSFLSKLGQRLYEIKLTLINNLSNHQPLFILHLSRVTNNLVRIINRLNQSGLTPREFEIATLIFQGASTRGISETLHLRYADFHGVHSFIK